MNENPEEMTIAKLEVLVMPNGEILSKGNSIGFVTGNNGLGKFLSELKPAVN